MELLHWVLANYNSLTVGSLFALLFVGTSYALHKGWIVPGSHYDRCLEERDGFREQVEQRVEEDHQELKRLRDELYGKRP